MLGEQSNDFVNSNLSFNLNCFMNVKVDLSVSLTITDARYIGLII